MTQVVRYHRSAIASPPRLLTTPNLGTRRRRCRRRPLSHENFLSGAAAATDDVKERGLDHVGPKTTVPGIYEATHDAQSPATPTQPALPSTLNAHVSSIL